MRKVDFNVYTLGGKSCDLKWLHRRFATRRIVIAATAQSRNTVRLQAQKRPSSGRIFAHGAPRREEIPPILKTLDITPHVIVVTSCDRTRVAARLSAQSQFLCQGEPEMTQVLPTRSRPARNYAAVALFLAVYVGVLVFVFAPKDIFAVQSPTALLQTD
jgi:hypothetical protein